MPTEFQDDFLPSGGVREQVNGTHRGYNRRKRISLLWAHLPAYIKKPLLKLTWWGKWKHCRNQDHRFSFTRKDGRISSMTFCGREIAPSVSLHQLTDDFKGPVTIVATGPSALNHDWEALKKSGRKIVALTGGYGFLHEKGITPDLLVVTDPNFCAVGGFHVLNAVGVPLAIEYRSAVALEKHFPGALAGRRVFMMERVNGWYGLPRLNDIQLEVLNRQWGGPFHISNNSDPWRRSGWSYQPERGIYPSSTVAFVALELVIALGATDIEIVGMDLGGSASIYANARPSKLQEQYESVILPSFLAMKSALENREIHIRNLSPTCPLPADIFQYSSSIPKEAEETGCCKP